LLKRVKTRTRLISNTNKTKEKELVKEKKCLEKKKEKELSKINKQLLTTYKEIIKESLN
jgi:hypothetical protein